MPETFEALFDHFFYLFGGSEKSRYWSAEVCGKVVSLLETYFVIYYFILINLNLNLSSGSLSVLVFWIAIRLSLLDRYPSYIHSLVLCFQLHSCQYHICTLDHLKYKPRHCFICVLNQSLGTRLTAKTFLIFLLTAKLNLHHPKWGSRLIGE